MRRLKRPTRIYTAIPEQLIHHQVIRTSFWEPFRLREMGMFLTYVNPHA